MIIKINLISNGALKKLSHTLAHTLKKRTISVMGCLRPAQYSTFVWPIPGSRRNGEAVKARPLILDATAHWVWAAVQWACKLVHPLVAVALAHLLQPPRLVRSGLDTEQQRPRPCRCGAGPLPVPAARRGLWPVCCVGAAAPRGACAAPPSAGHASCDRPRRRAEGLSGEFLPLHFMHVLSRQLLLNFSSISASQIRFDATPN
jgi:hypothetical protein